MDLITGLSWRYATKKFDDKRLLSDAAVTKLIQAFNLTATSYGLQPLQLVVVKNKALQKELRKHSFDQQQVAQASHVFVLCIETVIDKAFIQKSFKQVAAIRGTDPEILKPFESHVIASFSEKSAEEIELWASKQAYIALGTLLTACAIEGIDSCPMEGFVSSQYDAILSLTDKRLKSVLVLPIGYRANDDMFSDFQKVRREIDDTVTIVEKN